MHTGGVIVLVIVLLLLAAGIGWVVFARLRAQRLGLPPPSWSSFIPFGESRSSYGVQPAPSGFGGWLQDKWRGLRGGRNSRTAVGAYEGSGAGSRAAARHGFGPLDPDDAWDARVGAEADAYYYNEEQELGLHTNQHANSSRLNVGVSNTAYLGSGAAGGSSYDMNVPTAAGGDELQERGRTRGRSPNAAAAAAAGTGAPNPFDDDADPSNISLRGVSPRPMADPTAGRGDNGDSPTERRSMFRENV